VTELRHLPDRAGDFTTSLTSSRNGAGAGTAVVLQRETDWNAVLERLQKEFDEDDRDAIAVRVFECVVSALVLVLTAPIILIITILIRCDSPGPALFRQYRVGKGGRLFRFTKFRTLFADAKERFPDLYAYQYNPQEIELLCFKVPDDPRVTRLGTWLRRSTLDELPNFWHVLTGEIALVGPRPEIPEMLPYYTDKELVKFSVRPGITGFAQISGRGRLRFRETARLDVEYVQKRNFWLDLKIMIRTLHLIVRRDGAF
jgi:lipopolysaccharide/colanic/teichoic acid biosynthesis glycosyltransferase